MIVMITTTMMRLNLFRARGRIAPPPNPTKLNSTREQDVGETAFVLSCMARFVASTKVGTTRGLDKRLLYWDR